MTQLFSILLAASIAVGVKADAGKLIPGTLANLNEFPYQVSLRLDGKHFCGGALVNKNHVLTAGHCVQTVEDQDLNTLTAIVGTNSLSDGGYAYTSLDLSKHPNYTKSNPDWMYDVGVITIFPEVKLSSSVALVKLPTKDVKPSQSAMISGWGSMQDPSKPASQDLLKLDVNVLSPDECRKAMPSSAKVNDAVICTYAKNGAGTCSGDNGGPLVANGEVIGIASARVPCADGHPDVFTSVYDYLPYIEDALKKNGE